MWQPFIKAIKAREPHAVLVFEKIHIVRHLMEVIDHVRRDEMREKGKVLTQEVCGTHAPCVAEDPRNLTVNQNIRRGERERLNLRINRAYPRKEAFLGFRSYRYRGWVKRYFGRCCWWATDSAFAANG